MNVDFGDRDPMSEVTNGDLREAVAILKTEMKAQQQISELMAADVKSLLAARQLEAGRTIAITSIKGMILTGLGAGGIKLIEWLAHMANNSPPHSP